MKMDLGYYINVKQLILFFMKTKEFFVEKELGNDYVTVENKPNDVANESWIDAAYDDFCVISNNH
jgi:hypothetical protein